MYQEIIRKKIKLKKTTMEVTHYIKKYRRKNKIEEDNY